LKVIEIDRIDDASCSVIERIFTEVGAVLVRLDQISMLDFEQLTQWLCTDFHEVGTRQGMRQQFGDGFTTEVFRSNFVLLGHSEGAYRPCPFPDVCFFFCVTPPKFGGGETTVIDGAAMLDAMPSTLRRRLEKEGVIYESLWDEARWKVEFGVIDLDSLCVLLDGMPNVRFNIYGNTLHLLYAAPAISCARDGQQVFANGILAHLPTINHPRYVKLPVYMKATNGVYFGSGEPLLDEDVNALIDAHDRVQHCHRWSFNEVLILDNTRFMHGRQMTLAPCERVLASRFGQLKKPTEPYD
jgi:alpha-ketoglutarate-dependent taurine dioxygenase